MRHSLQASIAPLVLGASLLVLCNEAGFDAAVAESSAQPKKPSYRSRREAMFALTRIDFAKIVMLGDSLTEGAQWSEITPCHFIANRGIGADDSAGVLRRLDDVTKLKPEAVFLMIGVNDVASNVPRDKIVANVRQTIDRLTRSRAQVYLTLVLPVTEGYRQKINPKIDDLNTAYMAMARQTRASIIDFRAEVRTADGFLRDEMSVDGIHLTADGYRVWRNAIAAPVLRHCPNPFPAAATAAARAPVVGSARPASPYGDLGPITSRH